MARSSSSKRASLYADLEHLRTLFSSLDPDNTGYIGYQELSRLAQSESGMDESVVPELLEKLDRDKDGRVSFEDLQALFELEREAAKRQKLEGEKTHPRPPGGLNSPAKAGDYSSSQEYDTALDTTPAEILASPTPSGDSSDVFRTPSVVLRHKRPFRWSTGGAPSQGQGSGTLSPIMAGGTPPSGPTCLSPPAPDIATQMRYLTDIPESPCLKRTSRVLSWISESEDMFEDTGASREHTDGLLSPSPMSPTYGGGSGGSDEAAHVRSILEGVCHTHDIGREAVGKLCSHVQADPQEQQELLALLDHLDKEGKGHVNVDEFVSGLQAMRAVAGVAVISTPPPFSFSPAPTGRSRRYSDMPIPRLSEPFSSSPGSGKRTLPHLTSTPLLPPRKTEVYGDKPQLTVLDPNNAGYVAVETLAQQWQRMGVEPPHNQSLEDALREVLPVDSSRRVSVSEVTTSLETAVLSADKTQTTLRHAALLTFKGEISQLRGQLYQLSMERDRLRTSLNRTMEENKKVVRDGDEQLEHITKQSEKRARENELRLNERLREVEHEKQEEAKRLQELADRQREKLERELEELRASEEWLRSEFRLTQEETKKRLRQAKREFTDSGRGDRVDRMEVEQGDGEGQRARLEDLEQENAALLEQNKDLQERNRELQDRVDELGADNENIKQKYTFQKRRLQRHRSEPRKLGSAPHSASHLDDERRASRPRSGKRPSSAKRRSANPPSSLALISENADTHSRQESVDTLSPPLSPEPEEEMEEGEEEEEEERKAEGEGEGEGERSDDLHKSSSEDGLFAKSTASLLEEFQFEDHRASQERELNELRREKQELEESCQVLEQQLREAEHMSRRELSRQLQARRHRQAELERQIQNLEQQRRRLSSTKNEMDSQLARAEESLARQLEEIKGLRDTLSIDTTPTGLSHAHNSLEKLRRESSETSTETEPRLSSSSLLGELDIERMESMERSLDYQRQLEELRSELNASRVAIDKQETTHREEKERLKVELEAAKGQFRVKKDEQSKTLMRLGKELQSSQLALEQYKLDAQSLEDQLQKSRQAIKTKERELQLLQGKPQRKPPPILHAQPHDNEELTRLSEENKMLQEDMESRIAEAERAREADIQKLETQLALAQKETSQLSLQHEMELEEKKREYQSELARVKGEGESKVAAIRATMERELRMSKERYEIQVEGVQQELKVSRLNTAQLQGKLDSAEQQCESLLLEVSQHRETTSSQAAQFKELQQLQVQQEEELALQLKATQERDSQLAQAANKERVLRGQVSHLQQQLRQSQQRQAALVEDIAMEDTDYSFQAVLPTSPIMSPSRHSYQSDRSFHEEIVTQMKSQLEELQMCLVQQQQSTPSKTNQLSLVQELLATNSTLQENLDREQVERERELALLEVRDLEIQALREKLEEHHSELVDLKNAVSERLGQTLKSLQQKSNASIDDSSAKLEAASMAVAQLSEILRARDERHTSALETLFSEMSQSRITQESYLQEVEQLHSTLDRSREELDHSEQELKRMLDTKEREVGQLREMLDEAQANYQSLQAKMEDLDREPPTVMQPPSTPGHRLLEDKEVEMEALREEARRAELLRSKAQSTTEAARNEMRQRKEQMDQMEAEIRSKEQEISKLQHKLETVVNEPIEAVMQYMESAPLESASDTVFASMEQQVQAGRRHSMQLEANHRDEVEKLRQERDRSMSESSQLEEQVLALKQAVQEQEAELRTSQEKMETDRRERDMDDKQRQGRAQDEYSQELHSAQAAAELHRSQLRAVCGRLLTLPPDTDNMDYTALAQQAQDEIETLLRKLSDEQSLRYELEVSVEEREAEWEAQESQWQVEHEEEVRALHQRNSQLSQQLDDTSSQYQDFIAEQEKQNALLLQDLMNKQAGLERELELRMRELDHASSQAQSSSHEREVLLDIMQQLCQEMQKPLSLDIS